MSFRPCALIPTYNHVNALEATVAQLRALSLPVIVFDDGSEPSAARQIAEICHAREGVEYARNTTNGGKGAAVISGLQLAAARGYSHALQVDADGQHDLSRSAALLDIARDNPQALVTGKPIFDESVPCTRLVARWITHIWVSINTLSLRVIDSMCGFRVYPVAATLAAAEENEIAKRMAFDTEVLVRMVWNGTPVIAIPVRVIYPAGNHSNFRLWQDNLELSAMHARLFFTMLWRIVVRTLIPRPSSKSDANPAHWATLGERGSYAGLWLLAIIFRVFGRRFCLIAMSPVVLFFFLTGSEQRRASRDYLDRAWRAGYIPQKPGLLLSFRHFLAFASSALDKFAGWIGRVEPDTVDGIDEGEFADLKRSGRGVLLLTAHLGNPEVIRAIASLHRRWRVNVLVHTSNAVRFNALIERFSASSTVRMIQVSKIGPDTAILLKTAIDNGEWVVMAADRVPVTGGERVSWAPFLGRLAPFPQGPHILGAILRCPVYTLFCLRIAGRYRISLNPFDEQISLPRGRRNEALSASVARYAALLEAHVKIAPLQWFNFFDFWRPAGMTPPVEISGDVMRTRDLVI